MPPYYEKSLPHQSGGLGRNALPSGSASVAVSANRNVKYTCLRALGGEFLDVRIWSERSSSTKVAFIWDQPDIRVRRLRPILCSFYFRVQAFDGEGQEPLA